MDDAAGLDSGAANIFDETAEEEAEEEILGEVKPGDDVDAGDGYVPDADLGAENAGGVVLHYKGEDWLDGIPSRDDLVVKSGGKTSAALRQHLEAGRQIFFMPTDLEETNVYTDGYPVYALRIFGALMDGSKADVTVTGIDVFFDVQVPVGASPAAFDGHLRGVLAGEGAAGARLETVMAFPIRGYHTEKVPFKRVHMSNLQQRKKAIAAVRGAGLSTASDDRSCYYRKAAREEGLPLSDWAVLRDYEYTAGPTDRSPLCAHVLTVPVGGYRPLVDTMASKKDRDEAARVKAKAPLLAKDRTLVMTWDLESHSDRGMGDLPDAARSGDNAFMVCLTAHWKDDPSPLCQVCLVDVETAPDRRWTTVVCGSPANVLRAFALCWRALAPDIVTGFNDSNYDWPFVVEKARQYKILGWMWDMMSASPRRTTTDDSVLRWNYARDKRIKITAEEQFTSSYLKVPGAVPIDARVCFKKLYPKSETPKAGSLKFYLEICGLPSKADMPIKRMWHYYEEALATEGEPDARTAGHMREVANYCVIDALSCQRLLVRRGVINDYREVSTLAFVSLFDSHYYAGGMKVCNLLGAYAWRRGVLVSMIPNERAETGKYPGAYVFPPQKGIAPDPGRLAAIEAAAAALRRAEAEGAGPEALAGGQEALAAAFAAFLDDRPVTGLDFSSLYPSLIMTYNLSPEKILLDPGEAARWEAAGRKLHAIKFDFNGRAVRGWSVRHGNAPEELGLFPSVLIDLFNKRAEVKVVLGAHGAVKELIELVFGRAKKDMVSTAEAVRRVAAEAAAEKAATDAGLAPGAPPPRISPGSTLAEELADLKRLNRNAREKLEGIDRLYEQAGGRGAPDAALEGAVRAEYDRACFDWTAANTKQNALKVYMNTFYGEAGNSLSPFFLLELAGGVTSAGQYNIKAVADFVRGRGFRIKYGDTDSLYLIAPAKYFEGCDADYAAGRATREEWWSAMVRITMRALNQIRDEVNAFLKGDNGSAYLKMAYEEVLYPVVFTGKKKYFGIPHLNEVNFRPKKLFVKGIDVVKQGQPGLAREIGHRIMWACMALDNRRTVLEIVRDTLRDAVVNGAQWNFDHFVKTDAWKPHKNNVAVHRFIARMRARHALEVAEAERAAAGGGTPRPYVYELPEPGERFSYVLVKTGAAFGLRGCKTDIKKGDRMEFAKVAREQGLEVDVAVYMISNVIGLCARFVNAEPEFQPPPSARLTDKKIDELSQKSAKKALENFIRGLSDLDSGTLRKRGYAYRRAFGRAADTAREALVARVGAGAEVLHGAWLNFELFGADEEGADPEAPVAAAVGQAVDAAWAAAADYAEAYTAAESPGWCAEIALLLGIGLDGADAPASAVEKTGTVVAAATAAAAGAKESPLAAGRPGAPAGARAAPKPAPKPATELFRATAAPKRRPGPNPTLSFLDRAEAALRPKMAALVPAVAEVAVRYETDLARLVTYHRAQEHEAVPEIGAPEAALVAEAAGVDPAAAVQGVAPEDAPVLLEFRALWFEAVGVQIARRQLAQYAAHLARLKDRRLGVVAAPPRAGRAAAVAAAAARLRPTGTDYDAV
jgi:DNA polymerase elongation subunit (family B)